MANALLNVRVHHYTCQVPTPAMQECGIFKSYQSFANKSFVSRKVKWFRVIPLTERHLQLVSASQRKRLCGQLTLRGPWLLEVHFAESSFPIQHQLGLYTIVTLVQSRNARNSSPRTILTASPQIGIRPTKQNWAPSASALKMSDPRRMPPSIVICIRPLVMGAHCRSASTVAGIPSSCRPPWLEMIIPSTPKDTAFSTSSGDVMPFSHISIFVCACSQGMTSAHSSVSSKAVGPPPVPNSLLPVDTMFGNERLVGSLNLFCISPSLRPSTETSTDRNKALYPTSMDVLVPHIDSLGR